METFMLLVSPEASTEVDMVKLFEAKDANSALKKIKTRIKTFEKKGKGFEMNLVQLVQGFSAKQ